VTTRWPVGAVLSEEHGLTDSSLFAVAMCARGRVRKMRERAYKELGERLERVKKVSAVLDRMKVEKDVMVSLSPAHGSTCRDMLMLQSLWWLCCGRENVLAKGAVLWVAARGPDRRRGVGVGRGGGESARCRRRRTASRQCTSGSGRGHDSCV
jgi:hypothetical protein